MSSEEAISNAPSMSTSTTITAQNHVQTKEIKVGWTGRHKPITGHYGGVHSFSEMMQKSVSNCKKNDVDEESGTKTKGVTEDSDATKNEGNIAVMQGYERVAHTAALYLRSICPNELEGVDRVVLR
jgi:hypothetical protein